jgi:hypothetical protein
MSALPAFATLGDKTQIEVDTMTLLIMTLLITALLKMTILITLDTGDITYN